MKNKIKPKLRSRSGNLETKKQTREKYETETLEGDVALDLENLGATFGSLSPMNRNMKLGSRSTFTFRWNYAEEPLASFFTIIHGWA